MNNKCCMYKDDRCYALKDIEYAKYLKAGKCGNMGCPFYKEHKMQLRLGDKLIETRRYTE